MATKYLRNNDDKIVFSILKEGRRDKTGILYRTADYMVRYPEDEMTLDIRQWMFGQISAAFMNPLIDRAIDIPDEYSYTKRIELYKVLPFVNRYSPFRYYSTIFLKLDKEHRNDPVSLYRACKRFCNKYFKGQIDERYFDKAIETIEKYKLNFFSNSVSDLSFDEKRGLFVGKCGEYLVENWLETFKGRTTYVSRDCSSNFGFDILYDDPIWDKEVLIEVKSTCRTFEQENSINISKNERKVLNETISLPKTEYVIIRAYIDEASGEYTYLILYYDKNRDVFYNYDNPNFFIEYRRTCTKKKAKYTKVLIPKPKTYTKKS